MTEPPPVDSLDVGSSEVEPLWLRATAEASSVGRLRRGLRRWLSEVVTDLDVAEDLLLAISEAIENAVDHAFLDRSRGTVTVHAHRDAGEDAVSPAAVVISVVDDGHWRAPADPGYRGRGLALIAELCGSHVLEPGTTGTRVTVRHPL